MPTIAENLNEILQEKNNLKKSINAKNAGAITDSTPFADYPNAIDAIHARTLDMSDRIISDVMEIKDYTETSFNLKSCIKEVTIPEGVTSLGNYCFRSCSSLTSIAIPSGVTSIGGSCFRSCSSLQTVTCNAETPPTLGGGAFDNCNALTAIYVPAQSVDAYKSATNWSSYAAKIQAIP